MQAAMNTTKMALLFLSMIVLGATAHRLLEATSQKTGALHDAEEHQRILAELEEVHGLRERMLQQGKASSFIHLHMRYHCFSTNAPWRQKTLCLPVAC